MQIKKLRILLIILTLIQVGYLIITFIYPKLWIKLDFEYKVNWFILGLHIIVAGVLICFNCRKLSIDKRTKVNNTFLILFLGVIGMWLWIPNKREIEKMITI